MKTILLLLLATIGISNANADVGPLETAQIPAEAKKCSRELERERKALASLSPTIKVTSPGSQHMDTNTVK